MKPRLYNPDMGCGTPLRMSRSRSSRKTSVATLPPVSPPNPRQILLRLVDYIDSRLGNKINALNALINKNKRELRQAQSSFTRVEKEVFEIKSKTVQKSPICDDIRNFFKAMKNPGQDGDGISEFQESSYDLRDHLKLGKTVKKIKDENKENSPFVMAKVANKATPKPRSRTPVSKIKSNAFPGMRPPYFNPKTPIRPTPTPSKPTKASTPLKASRENHLQVLKQPQSNIVKSKPTIKPSTKPVTTYCPRTPSPLKRPETTVSPVKQPLVNRARVGQRPTDTQTSRPPITSHVTRSKTAVDHESKILVYHNDHLDFLEKAITEVDDEDSEQQRVSCVEPQETSCHPENDDKEENMIKDLMSFYEDAPSQTRKSKFVRLRDQNKYASLKRSEESNTKDLQVEYQSGVDEEDLKFFVGSFNMKSQNKQDDGKIEKIIVPAFKNRTIFNEPEQTNSDRYSKKSSQDDAESNARSSEFNQTTSRDDTIDGNDTNNKDIFERTRFLLKTKLEDEGKQIDSMLRETERLLEEKTRLERLEDNSCSPRRLSSEDKLSSEAKLMQEIENEKLEVAKMLENMMLSNTSVRDNHSTIENIFKKYQMTESEKKMTSLTNDDHQPEINTFKENESADSRKHVIQVDENFLSFNNQHQSSTSDLSNCKLTLVEEEKRGSASNFGQNRISTTDADDSSSMAKVANNLANQWNTLSMDMIRKPFAVLTQKNSKDKDSDPSYNSKQSSNCFYSSSSKDKMKEDPFKFRGSDDNSSVIKFDGFDSSNQK